LYRDGLNISSAKKVEKAKEMRAGKRVLGTILGLNSRGGQPNKSMHANCYAAFNRNWLGLCRRVGVESNLAHPQSRDFKR
jgi:hypothetical protein